MAPKNSMKRSEEPVDPTSTLGLHFPDWSGMEDSAVRITPEAAFRLTERYPPLISREHLQMREKCVVEFVL